MLATRLCPTLLVLGVCSTLASAEEAIPKIPLEDFERLQFTIKPKRGEIPLLLMFMAIFGIHEIKFQSGMAKQQHRSSRFFSGFCLICLAAVISIIATLGGLRPSLYGYSMTVLLVMMTGLNLVNLIYHHRRISTGSATKGA